MAAIIAVIKTAPAAKSLILPACSFFLGEIILTIFSRAVLIISKLITKLKVRIS